MLEGTAEAVAVTIVGYGNIIVRLIGLFKIQLAEKLLSLRQES